MIAIGRANNWKDSPNRGRGVWIPVYLAVGGVEERKNTVAILEAFLQVRRTSPSARLVVAGGASLVDHSPYASRFLVLAEEAGVAPGPDSLVKVLGRVADEDMPRLYRCADTLVFPSLREGFGLAVLEAMACGTPAVVSRIPPFTEYLTALAPGLIPGIRLRTRQR